jgi:hypothetical protein
MNDLAKQVVESSHKLQAAWTSLQINSASTLPRKCYEHWLKRAALHQPLSGTSAIFQGRNMAWDLVQSILKPNNIVGKPEDNKVRYGHIYMDFAMARHLALTSYVSVTWSIYDRLANVCGRLAGITDLADHPKQNPKPCEDLLGKKDILGFAGHLHLREAYAWPLKVSYKVRNWLVHEGYEEGSVSLFKSANLSDRFDLHSDASQYIQNCCDHRTDDGKMAASCITEIDESWNHGDLLRILSQYNGEIDVMFTALLKWSVDSFVGQIHAFAARDQV